MKNITHIALAVVFVVSCAVLTSSAQARRDTVQITLPSGTYTVRAPLSPLLKPAPISNPAPLSNPLPLWATQLIYPATSPFI